MFITIAPGCIACNVCSSLCPTVFTVTDTCTVNNTMVPGNEDACRHAARDCPVSVILIQE